jgi:hypothetical protein
MRALETANSVRKLSARIRPGCHCSSPVHIVGLNSGRKTILDVLHEPRYADLAPAEVAVGESTTNPPTVSCTLSRQSYCGYVYQANKKCESDPGPVCLENLLRRSTFQSLEIARKGRAEDDYRLRCLLKTVPLRLFAVAADFTNAVWGGEVSGPDPWLVSLVSWSGAHGHT